MGKSFFTIGIIYLILFEVARVYLIMPMPGSQQSDSIDIAYFLGRYQWVFRIIGFLLIAYGGYKIWTDGTKRSKWLAGIGLLIYGAVAYMFNLEMEADKMFLQPTYTVFAGEEQNKVKANKLVIGTNLNGDAKAYPIQLIGYHHQVVDSIGGQSAMITYCTVCRTGRIFSPIVDGKLETFRLVGMDHFNAMFEDQTTKSWWAQATGLCIAGPRKGMQLTEIPSEQLTIASWLRQYPDGKILQPDSTFKEIFEKMDVYDKGLSKSDLTKRDSSSWNKKSWVIGVSEKGTAKTYDWNILVNERLIQDSFPGLPILIALESDSSSFHALSRVVDQQALQFRITADSLIDLQTGSGWNLYGLSTSGPMKGKKLRKIKAYQEFLHSWEQFHPQSSR